MPRQQRRNRRLCLGTGAQCSALVSKLHPKPAILRNIINPTAQQRVSDLSAVRVADITRGVCSYRAVFFTYPSIPGEEVHCAIRFCKVEEEGAVEGRFSNEELGIHCPATKAEQDSPSEQEEQNGIDSSVFNAGNRREDIEFVRAQGLEVDNDNEPAPENIPVCNTNNSVLFTGQSWGFDGVDQRVATGATDQMPTFHGGWNPIGKSLLQIFLKLFPFKFMVDVIVTSTSEALTTKA